MNELPTDRCVCGCRRDAHVPFHAHHLEQDGSLRQCACFDFELAESITSPTVPDSSTDKKESQP